MTRVKFFVILLAGLALLGVEACEKSPTSPDDPPSSQLPPNPNPPVPAPPAKLYFRALDDDRQLDNIWIQDLVFKPPVNSTVIGFQTAGYSALNCAMNMCPEFTGTICAEVPIGSGIVSLGVDGQFFFSENPKDFKWYMGGDGGAVAKSEGQTVCSPFSYTNGATWLSPFPYGEPRYWEIKTTAGQVEQGAGEHTVLHEIPVYLSVPTGYYNPCVYQSPCIPQK